MPWVLLYRLETIPGHPGQPREPSNHSGGRWGSPGSPQLVDGGQHVISAVLGTKHRRGPCLSSA